MMEKKRKRNSSWLDLPQHLLELILERLPLSDYIRFAAVCRLWESIQKDHRCRRHQAPSPLPWLIYFTVDSNARFCYSPFENRFYSLQLPDPKSTHCVASSHGWLLMILNWPDIAREPIAFYRPWKCETVLLNPVSGCEIRLPALKLEVDLPIGATMSSPPTDPNSVIAIANGSNFFIFRVGDPDWTRLRARMTLVASPVFCDGRFYCRGSVLRYIAVIEPLLPVPRIQLLEMDTSQMQTSKDLDFLVESNGELLAGVELQETIYLRHRNIKEYRVPWEETKGFRVFKADFVEKMWREIKSLGDRVLMISPRCSISLAATQLGRSGNKIYSDWKEFDLESGTIIHDRHGPRKYCKFWERPVSIWIVPSLY